MLPPSSGQSGGARVALVFRLRMSHSYFAFARCAYTVLAHVAVPRCLTGFGVVFVRLSGFSLPWTLVEVCLRFAPARRMHALRIRVAFALRLGESRHSDTS